MQSEEQKLRHPRPNPENNLVIVSNEPIAPDEFDTPLPSSDFWGVHAERFKKGLTKQPIVVEHPKQTYYLNKGDHYFVIENLKKRSIKCISCPIQHGGILEAHLLAHYKLENGVLYFKGKAINTTPKDFVVDNDEKKT